MTVAEETRAAVRERPFLYDALRAGVVNYAAAAATLDIDADPDAVATALRRHAAEIDARPPATGDARVTMERRVGAVGGPTATTTPTRCSSSPARGTPSARATPPPWSPAAASAPARSSASSGACARPARRWRRRRWRRTR
ncbi:hypothetical protein ACFQRB_15140 [Halobaculum litoreum]|uniref:Uncharacterized protein n=1 Tax=Halobaculum litoreum TaxID=3031998 RepID=A0ABD5XQJ8_9EURY